MVSLFVHPPEIGPLVILALLDDRAADGACLREQVEERIAIVPTDRALEHGHILGQALEDFEKGEFTLCARKLGNWRGECPTDDPVLVLLYRAVRAMVEGKPAGHPVWEFTEK